MLLIQDALPKSLGARLTTQTLEHYVTFPLYTKELIMKNVLTLALVDIGVLLG